MNRKLMILLTSLLTLINCQDNKKCFDNYTFESGYIRQPYFEIDSVKTSDIGCEYYVNTYIKLSDSAHISNGVLYLKNQKIFMVAEQSKNNPFLLFDLSLEKYASYQIEIELSGREYHFNVLFEDKLLTENNVVVKQYRIEKFYSDLFYEVEIELDAVFFVSENHGIMGSYLTGFDVDQSKMIISPAGNIFQEYIDYSNYVKRKLL